MQNRSSAPDMSNLSAGLGATLQALETQRLVHVKKAQTGLYIGLGVLAAGAIIVLAMNLSIFWILAPLLICGLIYNWTVSSARSAYSDEYKAFVMPALVSHFGNLNYQARPGLSQSDFIAANLFSRPDRYNSEDLIQGSIGATRLRMSEVHAEERHQTRDANGNHRTEYRDIFKGMLFIFDFNKNFVGQTYVLPEDVTGSMGAFGKMFQKMGAKMTGRGQLVELEDPEFERLFKVDSTDQIEARYILSSSLMRRLVDLRNRQNNVVAAAFIGGQMYLMLAKTDNWFEAPPMNTPLDMNALLPTLNQLYLATGVVNDLDLNTRIWSKQ
ncbi:hypothetical protein IAD21_05910 [Abditibacteriota bacterium]|nr:hypothetical protein IAD21_05910 [Abditibacteriota bacterium]